MADIEQLPPAWHIPAPRPGPNIGQRKPTPQRKPDADSRHREQPERRDHDDDAHIDEYA